MSLSKNINPSLVLVQPRKTRPFITERLLMGCKNQIKQTKKNYENGFQAISFEYIGVLDTYFIHRYIIINYRSSSVIDKIH